MNKIIKINSSEELKRKYGYTILSDDNIYLTEYEFNDNIHAVVIVHGDYSKHSTKVLVNCSYHNKFIHYVIMKLNLITQFSPITLSNYEYLLNLSALSINSYQELIDIIKKDCNELIYEENKITNLNNIYQDLLLDTHEFSSQYLTKNECYIY